eukprot:11244583-Alexandrium_andersonii.AAC.1
MLARGHCRKEEQRRENTLRETPGSCDLKCEANHETNFPATAHTEIAIARHPHTGPAGNPNTERPKHVIGKRLFILYGSGEETEYAVVRFRLGLGVRNAITFTHCLLYTSDAADDM